MFTIFIVISTSPPSFREAGTSWLKFLSREVFSLFRGFLYRYRSTHRYSTLSSLGDNDKPPRSIPREVLTRHAIERPAIEGPESTADDDGIDRGDGVDLSYVQADIGRQGGRENVSRVDNKDLMPLSSLLKWSASKGKEKAKPGKGSSGVPSLMAPH